MGIGLIIIGDEIMSGKRQDKHFPKLVELLAARDLELNWAVYLTDNPEDITATLKRSFASEDIVFCCGGIGSTPDDHTRQCAARALNRPLVLHPEAREKIMIRIREVAEQQNRAVDLNAPDNRQRMKMGEFPEGARIIPNPINHIPGFSCGTHYFLPGFPEMAAPMMAWALDHYHSALFHQHRIREVSLVVHGIAEALMTPVMEQVQKAYPAQRLFSLPHIATATSGPYVEVGTRGEEAALPEAFEALKKGLDQLQVTYQIKTAS